MKRIKTRFSKNLLRLTTFFIVPVAMMILIVGCKKDDTDPPPPDPGPWKAANSTCIASNCHGNPNLKKDIIVTGGTTESIPLYVDSAEFVANQHKAILCTDCHTDIVLSGGTHGKSVKVFGGWARFSQKSGTKALATPDSTRNYGTAASTSCNSCHAAQHNANAAHIKIPRLKGASIRNFGGHPVGEAYEDNNCGRCHATCATCHFESDITPKANYHADLLIQSNWDGIQTSGDNYNGVNWNDATEWRMDWTTNVRSHNFRNKAALESSNDVCKSCHIGYYRPASKGYAMRDGVVDSMLATGIKRHPQFQELALGTVHQSTTCVKCHGASLHNQVSIADGPECIDCHAGKDVNHPSVNHMNLSGGVKIKCISCHTKHRAADFNETGQNNWINPEVTTHPEIGPVTVKYSELLNWYPHYMSKTVDCANLCHFDGNRVGAHALKKGPYVSIQPHLYEVRIRPGETDE